MSSKYKALIFVIIFASISLVVWFKSAGQENSSRFISRPKLVMLPKFEVQALDGNMWSVERDLKLNQGQKVLIHFWGTWCGPCEAEFPGLVAFLARPEQQKVLKAVLIATNDKIPDVKKFLDKLKDKLPNQVVVLVDEPGQVERLFSTIQVPETYIFDENFKTIQKFVGPQDWNSEYFSQLLSH